MRYSLKLIPALLLAPVVTACSYGPQNQEFGYNGASYAHHNGSYQAQGVSSQGDLICSSAGCAPSATYSVSNKPSHNYGHAPHQPSYDAYGTQVEKSHANAGYGHSPQLRGSYGTSPRKQYLYGTLGAVNYDVDSDLFGIQGRVGYQVNEILGAEIEGSFGVSGDDVIYDIGAGPTPGELEVDHQVGAFALARLPLSRKFSAHGRVGYQLTRSKVDGIKLKSDGIAYGGGVEYSLNPNNAIRIDYTRYDQEIGTADSVAVSYARKF